MDKRDLNRGRRRRLHPLRALAVDKAFRQAVYELRAAFGASPQQRREREQHYLNETHQWRQAHPQRGPSIPNMALNECLTELGLQIDPQNEQHERNQRRAARTLEDLRHQLRVGHKKSPWTQGRHLDSRVVYAAVFMDFDGNEVDIWMDECLRGPLFGHDWFGYLSEGDWRDVKNLPLRMTVVKPFRIYLDVTERDLGGVVELWPHVQHFQAVLGTTPPARGVGPRPGSPRKAIKVKDDKTWQDIRDEARHHPSELARIENDYIDHIVATRRTQWLQAHPSEQEPPKNLRLLWRRRAKDNFYTQVIRHPSMRGLNLRPPRETGRPRKP